MITEHCQSSAAYLDGILLCLPGEKRVTLTWGDQQQRFLVNDKGDVRRITDEGEVLADEQAFELYRMSFLEAMLEGGSVIIRHLDAAEVALPESLGGASLKVDHLYGGRISDKGIRGLSAEQLRTAYPGGTAEGAEFRSLPGKEQVRVALMKRIEQDAA